MKIKCIQPPLSTGYCPITFGKIYNVLNKDELHYKITDDSGTEEWFSKGRFEVINNNKGEKMFNEGQVVKCIKKTDGLKIGQICKVFKKAPESNMINLEGVNGVFPSENFTASVNSPTFQVVFSQESWGIEKKIIVSDHDGNTYELSEDDVKNLINFFNSFKKTKE